MNVYIKNKLIKLSKSDYITSGGEGHIYVKNNIAYKIYLDDKKAIPIQKIEELSVLKKSNIIIPIDMITNTKNGKVIGYTMQNIQNSISLVQLFPKVFKDRNNISPKQILKLVNLFRDSIKYCHDKSILLVDINEMNFLINKDFDNIYFIDTDSYETKSFPATAIMDSIRDRHSKKFSKQTDWFSFGILAFQMFLGIHPYKGKHSRYKTLDERMNNNISIFNKDVVIPKIIPPVNIIPKIYRDWMFAIFEKGKRIDPPFGEGQSIIINPINIEIDSSHFNTKLILELKDNILEYSRKYIITKKGLIVLIDNQLHKNIKYKHKIIFQHKNILAAGIRDDYLTIYNILTKKFIPTNIPCENIFVSENIYYVKQAEYILEIINQNDLYHSRKVARVLDKSTKIINGGLIQNLLGDIFISFFKQGGLHYQILIKELKSYRIIDGKIDKNIAVIIAEKKGILKKIIIKMNSSYDNYHIRMEDTNNSNINFTVLDKGIVVMENKNNYIELFNLKYNSNDIKIIQDNKLTIGKLSSIGNTVFNIIENKVYSITLK